MCLCVCACLLCSMVSNFIDRCFLFAWRTSMYLTYSGDYKGYDYATGNLCYMDSSENIVLSCTKQEQVLERESLYQILRLRASIGSYVNISIKYCIIENVTFLLVLNVVHVLFVLCT